MLPSKPQTSRLSLPSDSQARVGGRQNANTHTSLPTDQRTVGQVLVDAGALERRQLDDALTLEMATGRRLSDILTSCGYVDEKRLAFEVSREFALPWIAPHLIASPSEAGLLLPRWVAEEFCVLGVHVLRRSGHERTLLVATDDPTDRVAMEACAHWTQMTVRPMIALGSEIRRAIQGWYGTSPQRSQL
jgi:hypothetical protein